MTELNNNIEESICSLDVSKLLKVKGFTGGIFNPKNSYSYRERYDIKSFPTWVLDDREKPRIDIVTNNSTQFKDLQWYYGEGMDYRNSQMFIAPTHSLAIEWIRLNFNIWIEIRHIKTFGFNRFHVVIWKYDNTDYYSLYTNEGGYLVFETPQEATESALIYVLKELI